MWENKAFRYTIIIVASLIVVGYLSMVLPSIDTFYPGTIINGKDYGFKSPAYVDNELYKNPADYNLEIKFRDRTETINGKDIGLSVNYLDELNSIKKSQNPLLWPKCFFDKEYVLTESVSFNEDELERILENYKSLNADLMEEPENPKIVVQDGVVVASYEDLGNTIENVNDVVSRIKDALIKGETSIDIDEEGFYKMPEYSIESDKVQRCVEYCNTIAGLDIEYKYGKCEIPISADQLLDTIKITDTYNYTISKAKVEEVVKSFSRLYDTYGTVRTFRTHDRQTIKVTNGDYGWKINVEEETDNLYNDIIHHNSVTREPAFEEVGYCYDDEDNDDIGSFYCEVDIENQHMYVYRSGRIIMQSDIVTGNTGLRRGTPTGIYGVDYKQTPAVLKGEDYETKVTYWMPFNGGVGFHDATWRGTFGGEIYKYNGSHGCVNLPYSFAQELFGTIEENMPVIVY